MAEKNNQKYREFFTLSRKLITAGRDAEQNEKLMSRIEKEDVIMHTAKPSSPFCIIKNPDKEDSKEMAVFCAKYSQAWKKSSVKKDIVVHVFLGKDVFKTPDMKTGTFGVKKFKSIIVKKKDIEEFERVLER